MSDTGKTLQKIKEHFLVAVIRGQSYEDGMVLAKRALSAGVNAIELTFTTPNCPTIIHDLKPQFPHALIGAGTVLSEAQALAAIEAGSDFIVSPGYADVIALSCQQQQTLYIPGVFTPTDIMRAIQSGYVHLKLFPASTLTADYLKVLKGPFPQVKFMPTGGITLSSLPNWKLTNVFAIGVGNELFRGDIKSFVDVIRQQKNQDSK
jgi:2-dehydro-3-deoxyphosphogluconate aldolase / (4S)-4-hydroxy-2-oxoglutarate aldolase